MVEVAAGDGVVTIAVRDTGAGIAAEDRDRVFEPFFTTKPVGEGTGLGLAVCKRIVEGMGGRIAITGQPGAGTEVAVPSPPGARWRSRSRRWPRRGRASGCGCW